MASEAPVLKDGTAPFNSLPSGVKVKVMKQGPGTGETVELGKLVTVEMTAAALNLNGVRFFTTKLEDGTPSPVVWKLGDGTAVPGLEEGMIGMHKGEVRRIIVPAALGYAAKGPNSGKYVPQPRSFVDQQALKSILENPNRDASVLFDVRVDRIR